MKSKATIPTYNICHIHDADHCDVFVTDLRSFIREHDGLVFPHRHSFYQLLLITQGGGQHVIDFETYGMEKGIVFFLAPGQVHEWIWQEETQGILVNFSTSLFGSYLANTLYLGQLIFFTGNGRHSLWETQEQEAVVGALFRQMLAESEAAADGYYDMLRGLLLQLFTLAQRHMHPPVKQDAPYLYQQLIDFERLVEQHYTKKKLPREYAGMLFITPNYLNALCSRLTGRSAGDLIRSRILLEAKRLLVNSSLSVSEIAWQLNFEDNSYFSRFFRKYEGMSPEAFKKARQKTPVLAHGTLMP